MNYEWIWYSMKYPTCSKCKQSIKVDYLKLQMEMDKHQEICWKGG